jgi:hypothetical protein
LKKEIKIIKTVFMIWLICSLILTCFVSVSFAKEPIYKAKVNIRIEWGDGAFKEPIVPRDEVVTLNLSVILEIITGEGFGAGLLETYSKKSSALIDLFILEYPSWCYVTLRFDLLETNISELSVAKTQIFLIVNENAPAFAEGYIKIRVKVGDLGLIKGDDQTFTLLFKPAYFPLIKTELPEKNTMEVDPTSNAVFPIKVENVGNAITKVFFEVENVPQGWTTSIKDSVILGESSDTSETVYLTVIPSSDLGYHYEDVIINVKITPTFGEDTDQMGNPIYGCFIVRNRGFSSIGLEFYLPIALIIFVIIVFIIRTYRKKYNKEKTWLKFFKI